jgi:hypothetical protein
LTIIFTGLEPFEDYSTAGSFTVLGLDNNDDQIYAVDGTPHNNQDTIKIYDLNNSWEYWTVANKGEIGIFGLEEDNGSELF